MQLASLKYVIFFIHMNLINCSSCSQVLIEGNDNIHSLSKLYQKFDYLPPFSYQKNFMRLKFKLP